MSRHIKTGTGIGMALLASVSLGLGAEPRADVESSAVAAPDLSLNTDKARLAVAHAHFLTARTLEDEGRMRDALAHYLAFLQGNTGEPQLVAHIAELALNYQGIEAALKLLEESIKANADRPEPYANLTQFALTHADESKDLRARAAEVAEEAVRKFPLNAQSYIAAVRVHLAEALRAKGEGATNGTAEAAMEAAEKVLDQAAKQNVPDPAYWLDVGRVALEVWPLADGENRAAHLAKVNPFFDKATEKALAAHDEESQLRLSDFYLFSNQIERATGICEGAVKRTGSLDARKRLVRLYDALDRNEESFNALQDLVKAYPLDVEHRKLLAAQYVQRAQNAARALKPDEAAGNYGKVVEHLQAALQAGGGDLNDYLQISHYMRFSQQPEEFERFTARAQQLYPGEPRMGYFRASALSQLKKYAEAAKAYEESAKLAETRAPEILDDQFHFAWGVALERSAQYDAAAREFQRSIDLTPTENPPQAASTMNYLGYMWLERGQHLDRAETLIRKANEMVPDNGSFVDSLGWLFFKQGKHAQALPELLRAEKLLRQEQPEPEPGDAEIYDHIAQTYDKLGQRDKALDYWKQALAVKPEVEEIKARAERELGLAKPKAPTPHVTPEEEKGTPGPKRG